jgi:hypothetical protein
MNPLARLTVATAATALALTPLGASYATATSGRTTDHYPAAS